MNNKITYLIRLYPLDTFFFGGETTFGQGDEGHYFAQSNYFPQQTTLLGMLRQQVLFQNRKSGFSDPELIGSESFKADGSVSDYGKIDQISPLMLCKSENGKHSFWLPEGREFGFYNDNRERLSQHPVHFEHAGNQTHYHGSTNKTFVPNLKNYKAKHGLPEMLVSLNGSRKMFIEHNPEHDNPFVGDGVLRKVFSVGIARERLKESQDDEGGFFKKSSFKLDKDWCFAFFAKLNSDVQLEDTFTTMGGERSPFMLKIQKAGINALDNENEFFNNLYTDAKQTVSKLVCISDCFVGSSVYEHCLFANADISPFRNIRSKIGITKHYNSLQAYNGTDDLQPHKSQRMYLIKRGSVFYFDKMNETILVSFFKNDNYRKAGFNFYKIVHPNN